MDFKWRSNLTIWVLVLFWGFLEFKFEKWDSEKSGTSGKRAKDSFWIEFQWKDEWRLMKTLITKAVCGFWIRSLINPWMRRLEGLEICTGKRCFAKTSSSVCVCVSISLCVLIKTTQMELINFKQYFWLPFALNLTGVSCCKGQYLDWNYILNWKGLALLNIPKYGFFIYMIRKLKWICIFSCCRVYAGIVDDCNYGHYIGKVIARC